MLNSDTLINGRVEYAVKMLGKKDVQEAKGTHIVREAIHTIRFHLQVKRGETGHSGAKLQKVDTGPYAGWGRSPSPKFQMN
jgi:hypothetical protein